MKHVAREISSLAELGNGKSKKPKKAVTLVDMQINKLEFGQPILFTIPMKLECATNKREHWGMIAGRKKIQRETSRRYTLASGVNIAPRFPMKITITRLGLRKMDGDNLQTSAKYVRDGIADALGIDDGDESKVTWLYSQEIGKSYGCRVTIKMS